MASLSKQDAFKAAIADINKNIMKQYDEEDNVITLFKDAPQEVECISTGSLVMDSILGGGFPKGRIIELFGKESSGKTSMALTAAANVQSAGGTVAFVDFENALDPRYSRKLGLNVDEIALSQPSSAEEGLEMIQLMADSGAVDLIIVDSIAAMVPLEVLNGSLQDQQMALLPRILSKSLAKLIRSASKNNTTIVFINQTREKVGFVLGNPETTPGGNAMKFFASQRIRVARTEQVKEGKETIGNKVKIKVIKNKIAPPFKEGETILTFNKGINVAAELCEVGPEAGAIAKPSKVSWVDPTVPDPETGEMYDPVSNKGGYKFAKSKADAIAALESDPELYERIYNRLYEILSQDDFDLDVEGNDLDIDRINAGNEYDFDPETGEIIKES